MLARNVEALSAFRIGTTAAAIPQVAVVIMPLAMYAYVAASVRDAADEMHQDMDKKTNESLDGIPEGRGGERKQWGSLLPNHEAVNSLDISSAVRPRDESFGHALAAAKLSNSSEVSLAQLRSETSSCVHPDRKCSGPMFKAKDGDVHCSKMMLIWTFVVMRGDGTAKPCTGGSVLMMGDDRMSSIETEQWNEMKADPHAMRLANQFGATAVVYISETPFKESAGTAGIKAKEFGYKNYPIRWYGSSGKEYALCGHGNIAAALYAAVRRVETQDTQDTQVVEYEELKLEASEGELGVTSSGSILAWPAGQPAQTKADDFVLTVGPSLANDDYLRKVELNMGPIGLYPTVPAPDQTAIKQSLAQVFLNLDVGEVGDVYVSNDVNRLVVMFLVTPPQLQTLQLRDFNPPEDTDAKSEYMLAYERTYARYFQGYPFRGLLPYVISEDGRHFFYRGFYPYLGFSEDVATGSANVYLSVHLKRDLGLGPDFTSTQHFGGGEPSGQMESSVMTNVLLRGNAQVSDRVEMDLVLDATHK